MPFWDILKKGFSRLYNSFKFKTQMQRIPFADVLRFNELNSKKHRKWL